MLPIKKLLITLCALFLLNGCSGDGDKTINGYIEADLVYISSPSGGLVKELPIQRGQVIKQGQLIAQLDPEPYRQNYQQAIAETEAAKFNTVDLETGETRQSVIESTQSQVEKAKANENFYNAYLKRAAYLVQTDSMSQQDYDQVHSNALQSDAELANTHSQLITLTSPARKLQIEASIANQQAANYNQLYQKWYLNQTTVTAPRNGHIYDIYIWTGERIANDRPIASILVPSQIKVIFFLPEPLLSKIKLGQKISFFMDGQPKAFNATVSFISDIAEYTPPVIYSQSSRKDLVFRIEARPKQNELDQIHPGQPISVKI
ncbi:HlyD family efflux transporter periplasmic adaptor subunit [Thiotrichales bacterium 19S3-7]|nr:HlyD family efflux transporter periplasmic adaptor subunit [Thiotrichales bacterium 19S3-7]MCF6801255.1 HlyD family efflux transporter periplasmic adaptor subunit [Thiotrichales bacterium 19S3-11]